LVGAWRRGGGQGGDVVVEFPSAVPSYAYIRTAFKKPRHANKTKLHADSCSFRFTRAAVVN
jgi:hypothetical protein